MHLAPSEKKICFNICRQFIYFVLTIGFIFFIHFLARCYHDETFLEYGVVENLQLLILLLSMGIFTFESFVFPKDRAILIMIASLCLLVFFRELDSWFDANLPIISWKFAFLFPILALVNLYYHRKEAKTSLFHFVQTPAFGLLCLAVMVGVAIAQCLGHRPFITAVLGPEASARIVRRIFEEGTEAIGYFFVLLSSLENYWSLPRSK